MDDPTREELIEMVFDLFQQACGNHNRRMNGEHYQEFDHYCISAYEDAQRLLIRLGKINKEDCLRN